MALTFLNIGTSEVVILLVIVLLMVIAIGHYGRNTILGYWGSIIVAILASPLVAFIVVFMLRRKKEGHFSQSR
ncbi:hypothetical protein B0I27_104244 [Arcticibacter pallidicorallinus]|uniref:Uncharacterized protein n=1 Tax=Arcticibacter pallidicorallinus TaxID=1259464 RepID=A0A2T0U5R5_9SPHI|nr:hypothetical protein [Arcticibacter pallidicorallinus]PRY53234.1 hypothetical protein B0I27_104244 [Arcticibacter pallidicorallinus]